MWVIVYPCSQTAGDHPTLLELQRFPAKDGFKDIVSEIQNDYQQLGVQLLKDNNGHRVAGIAAAKRDVPVQITIEILQQWLKGNGRLPVTWRTLVECLRDAKLNAVADDIESVLSQDPSIQLQEQPTSCTYVTISEL